MREVLRDVAIITTIWAAALIVSARVHQGIPSLPAALAGDSGHATATQLQTIPTTLVRR